MEKEGRYSTSGIAEDQYMPGSNGKVLKNLLGTAMQEEIERVETELLFEVSDQLLDELCRQNSASRDKVLKPLQTVYGS